MPRQNPRSRSAYRWLWLIAIALAVALFAFWYSRRADHEESRPSMLPAAQLSAAPKAGGVAVDLPGSRLNGTTSRSAAPSQGGDPAETVDPVATPLPAQ